MCLKVFSPGWEFLAFCLIPHLLGPAGSVRSVPRLVAFCPTEASPFRLACECFIPFTGRGMAPWLLVPTFLRTVCAQALALCQEPTWQKDWV